MSKDVQETIEWLSTECKGTIADLQEEGPKQISETIPELLGQEEIQFQETIADLFE